MRKLVDNWYALTKLGLAVGILCLAFGIPSSTAGSGATTDWCVAFEFSNGYVVDFWSYPGDCCDMSAQCGNDCMTQLGISPSSEVQDCSFYCNRGAWRSCVTGDCDW